MGTFHSLLVEDNGKLMRWDDSLSITLGLSFTMVPIFSLISTLKLVIHRLCKI